MIKLPSVKKFLFLFTIIFFAVETILAQQVINTTIQHDGRTRQYRLYVPASYSPSEPVPLVFSFHGFTNTIDIQYNQANFQPLAEANKFIFVTPQGVNNGWAIENVFGGSEDDLGFTDALIDRLEQQYNINSKRIYATGFSNGGFFSYRLACRLSNRFAAIASIAGSMTNRWIDNNTCSPQHPTPILQITGSNDTVIPITGSGLGKSIADVMDYWTDYNNGDSTPEVIQLGSGSTRSIWDNGDNGVTVEFIRVQGKGHSWNGGNINTSQEIWNFFSRFDIDGAINQNPPPNDTCSSTVSSFPYSESFEGNIGLWQQASGDDLNWTVDSNGTPSNGTGPSTAVNGSSYVYLEVSGNGQGFPDKRGILNSPCFDLSSLSNPTLQFSYHMIGNAVGNLTVEASTNNSGNWTPIFSRSGAQGTDWNEANVALGAYANESSVRLRINAISGDSWQGDIAIDALTVSQVSDNSPGDDCGLIDFNNAQLSSFSNQDADGTSQIANNGGGLILTNNTWKQIPFNYVVTANTVLEFDFTSTSQGEIHAVGFENDGSLTSTYYFKVHGTQNYGVTNFDNYSGSGTTTYTIPVGNFYTGSFDRLVFINDNDVGSSNNSLFANVKVYEGSCNGVTAREVIAQLSNEKAVIGDEEEGLGAVKMTPNPTSDAFTLNVNANTTKTISVGIYTILGQTKYEGQLNSGVNRFFARNLSLNTGMYIVKIQMEGESEVVKKLIIN